MKIIKKIKEAIEIGRKKSKKNKEKAKKQLEEIKQIPTKELRNLIHEKKESIELAEKEYFNRKDLPLLKKITLPLGDLMEGGIPSLVLGFFALGAIPKMFGVNNEFINPSNPSLGLNASFELVGEGGHLFFNKFFTIGSENPQLFFYLFIFGSFYLLVLPLLKIIYYLIKAIIKKIKRRNK